MKKIIYIVSNVDRWIAFEWTVEELSLKFDLQFILLNPGSSYLENYLLEKGVQTTRINYIGKRSLFKAVYKVWKILSANKPAIVHCHFIDACLVGLVAARLANIKIRIHTRHHSIFHHKYFKKGIYYDRLINLLSTKVIAISSVVKIVLTKDENVKENKIIEIHHGFDLSLFEKDSIDDKLKDQFSETKPIIGVVSRYIEWKGVVYIIAAFKNLLTDYPNALLLLLNARGPQQEEIKKLLREIPSSNYKEIPFTPDIRDYYQLMDIYVHAPIDHQVEAFGQTYVEALAAGIPSIFTLSGIANEFIENGKNAIVVPFKNSNAIYSSLRDLLSNSDLRQQLSIKGKEDVSGKFSLDIMVSKLESCYNA